MKVKGFDDTIDWYDKHAGEYAQTSNRVSPGALLDHFITMLPKKPEVLDAGCGAGRDSGFLYKKGAIVTGFDISVGLLEEANRRNPEVVFVDGSFLNLPFANNTFDGIWARASLVHLETINDLQTFLKEFYRVLKHKGILHIYTREQIGDIQTAFVSDKDTRYKRFFRFYTKDDIRRYLEEIRVYDKGN